MYQELKLTSALSPDEVTSSKSLLPQLGLLELQGVVEVTPEIEAACRSGLLPMADGTTGGKPDRPTAATAGSESPSGAEGEQKKKSLKEMEEEQQQQNPYPLGIISLDSKNPTKKCKFHCDGNVMVINGDIIPLKKSLLVLKKEERRNSSSSVVDGGGGGDSNGDAAATQRSKRNREDEEQQSQKVPVDTAGKALARAITSASQLESELLGTAAASQEEGGAATISAGGVEGSTLIHTTSSLLGLTGLDLIETMSTAVDDGTGFIAPLRMIVDDESGEAANTTNRSAAVVGKEKKANNFTFFIDENTPIEALRLASKRSKDESVLSGKSDHQNDGIVEEEYRVAGVVRAKTLFRAKPVRDVKL